MAVCGDLNNLATSIWKLWRAASKVMDYINYYNEVSDDSSEVETEDILKENENDKGLINDNEVEYDSFTTMVWLIQGGSYLTPKMMLFSTLDTAEEDNFWDYKLKIEDFWKNLQNLNGKLEEESLVFLFVVQLKNLNEKLDKRKDAEQMKKNARKYF